MCPPGSGTVLPGPMISFRERCPAQGMGRGIVQRLFNTHTGKRCFGNRFNPARLTIHQERIRVIVT